MCNSLEIYPVFRYYKMGESSRGFLFYRAIFPHLGYMLLSIKNSGGVTGSRGQSLDDPYVVFDIETTGFSPVANRIIEIGAVRVEEGSIVDRFSVFVNPQVPIPFKIEQLTGINDSMVVDAETIEEVLPKFLEFSKGWLILSNDLDSFLFAKNM